MNEKEYQSMMDQVQLSECSDRRIQEALKTAKPARRPVRRLAVAAAVVALLVTAAFGAALLKSEAFQKLWGPNAVQWENQINDTLFAECTMDHFQIQIVKTLFTRDTANLVVNLTALDDEGAKLLNRIDLQIEPNFYFKSGTSFEDILEPDYVYPGIESAPQGGYGYEVDEQPGPTENSRTLVFAIYSSNLKTFEPGYQLTLHFRAELGDEAVWIEDKEAMASVVEEEGYRASAGRYEVPVIGECSCTGVIDIVDEREKHVNIGKSPVQSIDMTSTSMDVYATEDIEALYCEHMDLLLELEDGSKVTVVEKDWHEWEDCLSNGYACYYEPDVFSTYFFREAIDVSQVTGVWLNGEFFPVTP